MDHSQSDEYVKEGDGIRFDSTHERVFDQTSAHETSRTAATQSQSHVRRRNRDLSLVS
jgi:hypothetical protein